MIKQFAFCGLMLIFLAITAVTCKRVKKCKNPKGFVNDKTCIDDVLYQCYKNKTWVTDGTSCGDQIQSFSGSVATIIENQAGRNCYGFFTDAKASSLIHLSSDPANPILQGQVKYLDFGNLKVTTAVISCYYGIPGITYAYLSPCGYDRSIDFSQPGKKYTIYSSYANCVITQISF